MALERSIPVTTWIQRIKPPLYSPLFCHDHVATSPLSKKIFTSNAFLNDTDLQSLFGRAATLRLRLVRLCLWGKIYALIALALRRAAMVMSYKTSLNAKRNAAVRTLWLTLGAIPRDHVSNVWMRWVSLRYPCRVRPNPPPWRSCSNSSTCPRGADPWWPHVLETWQ